MVYVEEKIIEGKTYYYLTKTSRHGTKWKKLRTYVGTKRPSEEEIEELSRKLDVPPKCKYLSTEQLTVLEKIKQQYKSYLSKLTEHDFRQYEDATLTHFTYNTNAIEGSTLSLMETGFVLHENRTPQGKDLREIYGAINMREAYNYLREMRDLTEGGIKKLHELVMKNILEREVGEYRTVPVVIIGSRTRTSLYTEVKKDMLKLIEWYNKNKDLHPFELACLLHIKFEKIHPFRDGNGRVGRLIMNFVLLSKGYPLLDIKVDRRLDYYAALEKAHLERKYKDFLNYAFETYKEDAKGFGWVY